MARKLLILAGMVLLTCALARSAWAQARYQLSGAPQRTATGARLTNVRLMPQQYNRVHIVLAQQGTTWNQLKQHPVQGKILADFGTHELVPNQVKEMNLDLTYGGDLQSGTRAVLATRFFTQGQSYIHVWGGSVSRVS